MRTFILSLVLLFVASLSSCTLYTEKRSEALSQAVYATADSIDAARFDLADKYSKEANKLAFAPKKRIKINSIITKSNQVAPILTVEKKPKFIHSVNLVTPSVTSNSTVTDTSSITSNATASNLSLNSEENTDVLRLVIPEKFKDAKILIEGSTEWNELLKSREFAKQLKTDIANLTKLKFSIETELAKQNKMNNEMVLSLNVMQKKLVQKDLAILQRNVVIVALLVSIAAMIYLRVKGIL